eukprot:2983487-Heterocapsa_arctica.AAC.1
MKGRSLYNLFIPDSCESIVGTASVGKLAGIGFEAQTWPLELRICPKLSACSEESNGDSEDVLTYYISL